MTANDRMGRIAVTVAWLLAMAGAVALEVAALYGAADPSEGGSALVFSALAAAVGVYATVGAILALRLPANLVGSILLVAAIMIGVTFLGYFLGAVLATDRGTDDVLAGILGLIGATSLLPTLILAGPALALVFPDGHLPGPRWRWPVLGLLALAVLSSALALVRPGPIGEDLANNPFVSPGAASLAELSDLGFTVSLPAIMLLAVAAVVVRFRRSRDVLRAQLKWFVAANVLVAVFLILAISDGGSGTTAFDILGVASLSLPPLAIGVAILRYRLYEIDRIISRTLGYAIVTGILVGIFAAVILLFQAVLSQFTQKQTIAVAASTLAVFALFEPVRRRVQSIVDRRFDRARYDGEQTVVAFAERLRDEVAIETVTVDLARTTRASVAPSELAIWLRVRSAGR